MFRSPLFIPGNQPSMLGKALDLNPDTFIPDLEDSVPINEKEHARIVTASYIPRLAATGPPVIPRVNSLDTGLMEGDLKAVVSPYIFGISIGKINSSKDVIDVANMISELEKERGLDPGHVKMVLWIETALSIVNAYQICTASPRIVAVAFGAEDFTNDMGIYRTSNELQTSYAKSRICIVARAAGVPALDTPYFSFRDDDGLRIDTNTAKMYGFRGKFAIHPGQIDIINEVFSPSHEEIRQAQRVITASQKAELEGRGSTSLDGKVIDAPVVKRALSLLETSANLAEKPGRTSDEE